MEAQTASFPLALLSEVPITIQHITLGFGVDYEGDFIKFWTEKVDWESLERKLLTCKGLQSLRFVWEIPYPVIFRETRLEQVPSTIRDTITKSLPRLYAAEKLLL